MDDHELVTRYDQGRAAKELALDVALSGRRPVVLDAAVDTGRSLSQTVTGGL